MYLLYVSYLCVVCECVHKLYIMLHECTAAHCSIDLSNPISKIGFVLTFGYFIVVPGFELMLSLVHLSVCI